MSDTLDCVIQDSLFATGEHSIKYGYVAVLKKQQETVCQSLLLVGFQHYVEKPLAQFLLLHYAAQVKFD